MPGITVEAKINFKQVENAINQTERANTDRFLSSALDAMGNHLINLIRMRAPQNTGDYAKSWRLKHVSTDTRKVTSPMGDLYIILEFRGAKRHEILAGILSGKSSKKALHYTDEHGVEHFYVRIDHPGFKNTPHVRPAVQQLKRDMPTIVLAAAAATFDKLLGKDLQPHLRRFTNKIGQRNASAIKVPLKPIKRTNRRR